MTTLTNDRFRRMTQRSWNRNEVPLPDLLFWEKEARFFIRLLEQCRSTDPNNEADAYDELTQRFRDFLHHLQSRKHAENQQEEFNPLNQTLAAGRQSVKPRHLGDLQREFKDLKEEAFQKVGRFFSVRIR